MNSKLVGMSVSEMAAYRSHKRRRWPHRSRASLAHPVIGYQMVITTQSFSCPRIHITLNETTDRQPLLRPSTTLLRRTGICWTTRECTILADGAL